MFSRSFLALPLLLLPVLTRDANAQPPRAPSAVKDNPTNWNGAVPAPIPDPPLITPAELQALTGGPTLVTFSGADVSVDEAVKALLDAAHLPANGFARQFEQKKLSVDWQQLPFWSAAAQIETASGGNWDGRFGEGLSLVNFNRGEGLGLDGAVAARTPFVTLIANSLTRTSTQVTFFGKRTATPRPDTSQVTLTAYFDPKLRVQTSALRALKFGKQGEANPVAVAGRGESFTMSSNNSIVSQQRLQLPAGAAPGTVFSSISGILHSEIVAATQVFAVPDVLATPNAEITIAGTRYQLQSAVREDAQLTVKVRLTPGEGARGFRNFSPFATLRVRDAQNRQLPFSSLSSIGNDSTLSFRLKNGDETFAGPYSLDWTIATTLKSLDVPFELRDVTVP